MGVGLHANARAGMCASTPARARVLFVDEIIDSRPLGRLQAWTIALCILVAALDGFDTQTIGMLAPSVAAEFGVPVKSFGPVFSAGLLGMLIGATMIAPLADRLGRKKIIVFSTLLFGALSLATACARSPDQLLALRLLTGLGLGGALPNAIALAAEYAPRRHARTTVTILMCGMPLGAVLGGLTTSALLHGYGWRPVFVVGGALPVGVTVLLVAFLPESVRFLLSGLRNAHSRERDSARVANIMQRIALDIGRNQRYGIGEKPLGETLLEGKPLAKKSLRGIPARELFTQGRAPVTILLWIPYFMNLVVLYFIVSWMPAVLNAARYPVSVGIMTITLFSLGGVLGSIIQGPLMNYFGTRRALLGEFLAYGLLAIVLANWTSHMGVIVGASFLLGVAVQGIQAGLNALAAEVYPTGMRATGVGCALGIGRIGSMSGPLIGGVMLSWQWTVSHIFLAGIVPALIAAVAIAASRYGAR